MKLAHLTGALSLLLLLAPAIHAQGQQVQLINFSALPFCANQCTLLKSAEGGCIPPAAPIDTTNTYTNCFCESALLTFMWSTSQGLCDGVCSAGDLSTIRKWFLGFCQGRQLPGVVVVPETGSSGGSPTTKAGSKATGGATAGGSGGSGNGGGNGSKLSWHSAGIPLLVTVLLLVFLVLLPASIFIYIRKRRRAAAESQQAARTSGVNTPVAWGPHQNMAWTQGYRYDIPGVVRKQEKGGVGAQDAEVGSQGSRTVGSGTSDETSVKREKREVRPRKDGGMF